MRIVYDASAIYQYRTRRGLTQVQLARRVGVSRATIITGERGVHGLRAGTLARIASVLHMPISAVFPIRRGMS